MPIRNVLYLHGFASSPKSAKAALLRDRLAPFGIVLGAPDFNEPDFSTLTVTRMLDQTARELTRLPAGPVALVGSSLGGFVAVHAAARQDPAAVAPIERLILLAPAFEFGRIGPRQDTPTRLPRRGPNAAAALGAPRWGPRQLGTAGIDRWKATDRLEVFHHGYGAIREVHYALYEDAQRYDACSLKLDVPTVIVYGTRDESVEPASVERWARGRANVTLRPVDDGHQLASSHDVIWLETAKALGLNR
jgi:pimeloyl-ACP methyl ester carboxylesterase